jgi:hypothetical protein
LPSCRLRRDDVPWVILSLLLLAVVESASAQEIRSTLNKIKETGMHLPRERLAKMSNGAIREVFGKAGFPAAGA